MPRPHIPAAAIARAKASFVGRSGARRRTLRFVRRCAGALLLAAAVPMVASAVTGVAAAAAQERVGSNSGLPVPRFVSLKSGKVNMRVGPGREYRVEWRYTRAGTPVEIVAEFDNWRRVRDAEGTEGWVYGALLTGRRTGVVAPWLRPPAPADVPGADGAVIPASTDGRPPAATDTAGETAAETGTDVPTIAIHARPDRASPPVAMLEAGVTGTLAECDGRWCRFEPHAERGAVSGWLRQIEVWGTYPDERIGD